MSFKRVVITGMGAVSPLGRGVEALMNSLSSGKSGIVSVPELSRLEGLRSRVAALVTDYDPKEIPRKFRRSMSPMSIYAVLACQEAIKQAGLSEIDLSGGRTGVAIGSTIGSPQTLELFLKDFFQDYSIERMKSSFFFQIMNHSCAANVSQTLGITGRIMAPSSACSSGCQAVGYGFETIAFGKQDFMLCGGSDEFHPLTTATFDMMNAASTTYNESPHNTPRPFDRDRDGVVCGEGCGILLLESLESAKRRGAEIFAEIIAFSTVSDTSSIANPCEDSIFLCMKTTLEEGHINSSDIDYINAHATATLQGDVVEAQAIHRLFGGETPVSSLKGHLGHTMAASGSLELIATTGMINMECMIPTLNLDTVDKSCEKIRHVKNVEKRQIKTAIKNSFALGGVNSSIVLRRYEND